MHKALLLDRDGVICKATPRGTYLLRLDQFVLMPGIVELVRAAKEQGYLVIVVTNQPQIGKGLLTVDELNQIHNQMPEELSEMIDMIAVCPHRNEDNCLCRKPKPGMIDQASEEFEIDRAESYILGDSDKDILAGQAAGVKTIFIQNEYNADELKKCKPDFVVDTLREVVPILK